MSSIEKSRGRRQIIKMIRIDAIAGRLCALVAAALILAVASSAAAQDRGRFADAVERAGELDQLNTLIIAIDGEPVVEEVLDGPGLDTPVNIKSAAKTVIAAMVGAAIARDVLSGPDQPIGPLLASRMPDDAEPGVADITTGNLLSMQSGLERTSGPNYGSWVASGNWTRYALSLPFVDRPGGRMLYSTGNSHILSAILTDAADRSTAELARLWLAEPLGIAIPPWQRAPEGIYFGGNNMAISPRGLLALGELYRNGGMAGEKCVFSQDWVETSWTPRTRSPFTGDEYGYGWFIRQMAGREAYYAWGYGSQMIHVVPELDLTVVITSDTDTPSGRGGYVNELHDLVGEEIIPAAAAARS